MAHVESFETYTHAFKVSAVGEEILAESDQTPTRLAFTVEAATETARNLLAAADQVRAAQAARDART